MNFSIGLVVGYLIGILVYPYRQKLIESKWHFFNFMADAGEWFLSYVEPKAGFERKPFKKWGKK